MKILFLCYNKIMDCNTQTPIVGNLQTIAINRGTYLGLKAQRLNMDGTPILLKADGIFFVIKKRWTDKTALITKTLEDMTFDEQGYYHFSISPEDTEDLPYGNYVWDFTSMYNDDAYRAKPAHGIFIIGNSSGWIVNEGGENGS